jgi:glycosyltransferase involved in cell wall biosynthesis
LIFVLEEKVILIEEKDFILYAKHRKGLNPRPLLANNFQLVLDELIEKYNVDGKEIIIVELGFNHGNDGRFICETLQKKIGDVGWQYWGYDHKNYFMPKNIMDSVVANKDNIHLVPCLFENLSKDISSLPPYISFCYSSKSLSLCDRECFLQLLRNINSRILYGGSFLCSLHINNDESKKFYDYPEYLKILNGKVFSEFESHYSINNKRQSFIFFSYKLGKHRTLEDDTLVEDDLDYIHVSNVEKQDFLVSVIVPIYNTEKFLSECLYSIINQTYKNIEIICIDDGSNDGSSKIIEKFLSFDQRIRCISQRNMGLSSARNVGIKNSNGSFIMFVDSDDVLDINAIEIGLFNITTTNSDILVFGAVPFPKEQSEHYTVLSNMLKSSFKEYTGKEIFEQAIFKEKNLQLFVWNKLYRKELFGNDVLFPEYIKFGEDRCFMFNIIQYSNKITFIGDDLYFYRQNRKNSLTNFYKNKPYERALCKINLSNYIFKCWISNEKHITSQIANKLLIDYLLQYINCSISQIDEDFQKKKIIEKAEKLFCEYL